MTLVGRTLSLIATIGGVVAVGGTGGAVAAPVAVAVAATLLDAAADVNGADRFALGRCLTT